MLGNLKKIFSKKQETTLAAENYEFESLSNPNFLTDANKIDKLLIDIENVSPLCTITFEGINEEFSSSILDVQVENKQIILDELIPKHGNALLLKKNHLKLSTIFNGIRLAFNLNNISAGNSKGIAYYKTHFPNRIYYPQRRDSPRIQINSLNIPFSGIANKTKSSIGGYIFDLSRNGIGISLQDNRSRIQRGHTIRNCKITINDQSIGFDLNIRFVKTVSPGSGKTLIGGNFESMPAKKLTKLTHFIAALEREEIRKRKS